MTVLTIETLEQKWIQIQGFLLAALFRTCSSLRSLAVDISDDGIVGILTSKFHTVILYPITPDLRHLQCYRAKLFPTQYRAFVHGISAASGKVGAITSASAFSTLSNTVGTAAILWRKFPMLYGFDSSLLVALIFDLMNSLL